MSNLAPSADVARCILDDRLAIFSERRQEICELQGAAAFIWCLFEEMTPIKDIVSMLKEAGVEEGAEGMVAQWMDHWLDNDWIGKSDRPGPAPFHDEWLAEHTADNEELEAISAARRAIRKNCCIRCFLIGGVAFNIAAQDEMTENAALAPFFHLEIDMQNAANASDKTVFIEILSTQDGFDIIIDDTYIDSYESAHQLAPALKMWMLETLLIHAEYDIALHASAVSHNDKTWLFPAISGSGKSTLIAGLASKGFTFHCDDCLFLNADGSLAPIVFPAAVKEGSWPVLSPAYPALLDGNIYLRPDEKKVKYLSLSGASLGDNAPTLVFSKYETGAELTISPLAPLAALERLLADAHARGQRLGRDEFLRLSSWMNGLTCQEMRYGSIDDVHTALLANAKK